MYGYIYKIIFPLDSFGLKGQPFYIGQRTSSFVDDDYYGSGTKVKDWFKKRGLNSKNCKKENILLLGIQKEILHICESFEELNSLEKEEVNKNLSNELCLNLKEGGKQALFTDDVKKRISSSVKEKFKEKDFYDKYKEAHTKYFLENKEVISQFARENAAKTGNLKKGADAAAKKHKEITSDKEARELRRQKKNKNMQFRKVKCIETGTIYDNAHYAEFITKIKHIQEVCKGIRHSAGGYHWEYIE